MADYRLPYGKTTLTVTLPDTWPVTVIAPAETPAARDLPSLISAALDHPAGGVSLSGFAGARSVAVVISDKTRPVPQAALTVLLDRLEALGFAPDAITLLVATGTHAPMLPGEFTKVLPGSILARYMVESHDCDAGDLVYQGQTPRGTPVWTNARFAGAELRIVVGNVEPHQFMGFSGGVKSAAIGLAGRETINRNHAMMRDPRADLGRYDDNPVRQDVEDIGRLMGVHFALNAVLTREKQVAQVVAGDPVAVMRAAIPLVRDWFEVRVPVPFDLVITAPGGYPKDINLYQAQKALGHAARIVRPGGTIILVAACPEGSGSAGYERWVTGMESHAAVLERFGREEFRLGPHKAFQIARDAQKARVLFVSEMSQVQANALLLDRYGSIDEALAVALSGLAPGASIALLPMANATIPVLAEPAG